MEDWIAIVESGGFIDYDGMGDYSDSKNIFHEGLKWVHPSDVKSGRIDRSYSHIVWYNR